MEERKDGVHVSQLFGNKNLNRAKTIHPPKQEEPKLEQVEEKQELNTEKQKKEVQDFIKFIKMRDHNKEEVLGFECF